MVNIRSKSEAKKLGLKYYFTGKPCKYGHVAERRVCNSTCKECHLIAVKEHDKTRSGYFRDYNNTEERKLYMKEYGVNYENKEIVHAKYFSSEKGKGTQRSNLAKRRAAKLQRTPVWSESEAIREFYQNCPKGYQVDHIIPLQGELVSGLHVIGNLQYLTIAENREKSNHFEVG